jgi:hypothetical protein
MKAKHKYILTLSTLALFLISVFIGYFISTRSISKAMKSEGGGCSYTTCQIDSDCCPKDNKLGKCIITPSGKECNWNYKCEDNGNCVDSACCDKYTSIYNGNCFKGIYSDNKYLCESK